MPKTALVKSYNSLMPTPNMVTVQSLEGEKDFEITNKTTGQEFIDMVNESFGLGEQPFFNLQYVDAKDYEAFVNPEKKVLSHDLKKVGKEEKHVFVFRAQYFPEMVSDELTNLTAARLLWRQVRDEIRADECYAPPELCVLFAAQSLQALHGDESTNESLPIEANSELPPRVVVQHQLTPEQWADRIRNAWKGLQGVSQQQAYMDYLGIAQDLEQYGLTYFEIHNKKGCPPQLIISCMNNLPPYPCGSLVTPRLGFPWTEIRNISFNDKKFTIKMVDAKAPDFKFFSPRFKLNKRILALCVRNHQLYVARRRKQLSGEGMMEDRAALEAKIRKTKDQLLVSVKFCPLSSAAQRDEKKQETERVVDDALRPTQQSETPQAKAIRADLESVKDATKETREDRIHKENEAAGMDKLKTMKKAQSGDAVRRIEMFEELEDAEC
ncbi:uncharacterized protein MONBRDRAFT_32815 [Monosiga brevicollis MX1]|uniref:FERM domain-containing protein n=1 Tax=Monosiga brevicollis TaxID=81824 RepID=A9V1V5_MONBE|nr:uncharacterized protein MONBRDRAFT_32815 [Monosiga brevicollis MX1]EDQ88509.1 predicted protein [Monosiga brevicollis MX1]|eukprot:XP_001746613.1 hypothetical protein [Monosiga brevicollis MX1]